MDVLVSVIMPAYNAGQWIAEAIEGMKRQTYSNWELVIVNDGSTDETVEICKKFIENDKRIHLYSQCNKGPSAARNFGIENASGDYFTFIDSDDRLENTAIERYVEAAKKCDADTVIAGYCVENEITRQSSAFSYSSEQVFHICNNINTIEVEKLLDAGLMASNWNKLYRKSLLDIRFSNQLSINEDVLYSLEALFNSKTVIIIPDTLYIYKIQNTASVSQKFHPEMPDALDALENQLIMGQSNKLRLGIARWLMNYMFIYFKIIASARVSETEKTNYLAKATNSKAFQHYGNIKTADTKNRKVAIFLLNLHLYKLYLRILQRHAGRK